MATLLQITDLHLKAEADGVLKGVPTQASLKDVLRELDRQIASEGWEVDYLIITGDIAHDEQTATYEVCRELLREWSDRCRLVPGNHDDRDSIRQTFPDSPSDVEPYLGFSCQVENWRLIGLDTHLPGQVAGEVGGVQRSWLEAELQQHRSAPTIVFLHHPPFDIDAPWLDEIGLRDAEQLMEILARNEQVKAVSAGHVHQEFDELRQGLRLLTTPSTAVQFRPRTDVTTFDGLPPGFRLFELQDDELRTEVFRLDSLRFPPKE